MKRLHWSGHAPPAQLQHSLCSGRTSRGHDDIRGRTTYGVHQPAFIYEVHCHASCDGAAQLLPRFQACYSPVYIWAYVPDSTYGSVPRRMMAEVVLRSSWSTFCDVESTDYPMRSSLLFDGIL
uniref:Uncharacterized protein n=1 Tax=Ascaris lumbricoides TaxID=6252 RepID=A0A0M3HUU9_ASCLU